MYGKIFESMYEGTLYGQWQAIITFQQLIVLADKDGIVDMTPPAIAARTSIPLEHIEKGIEVLTKEDKYSRSDKNNGKRIILTDEARPWGWQIVNYDYYCKIASREDKREQDRIRISEKRSKNKDVADGREESQSVADVAYVDVDVDVDVKKKEGAKAPLAQKATRLPEDWKLPEVWFDWAFKNSMLKRGEIDIEATKFHNHWKALSGQKATKLDWYATWQNWVLRYHAKIPETKKDYNAELAILEKKRKRENWGDSMYRFELDRLNKRFKK